VNVIWSTTVVNSRAPMPGDPLACPAARIGGARSDLTRS